MDSNLIIRTSDRAIFEASCPDDYSDADAHMDMLAGGADYFFRRLEWMPYKPFRSWAWNFGGRLVRTGEVWEPQCDSEFDVVNREIVIEGCKALAKRK